MSATPNIPTLEDVAKRAGVSTATVSRCLNAPEKLSNKSRDRVMKAVDALGYTPNFGARAMAAKRTFTIGAIIPTMENAIFARGLQAFQEELHRLGYTLLVASNAYSPEREAEQVKALVSRGADALLLIGQERNTAIYDFLNARGIPAITAWSYARNGALPSIGFDNRAAMKMLTEHVLSYGHRNIGVISGIVAGNDRAAGRLQGIRAALAAAGLDPDAPRVIETSYEVENGARAFETLMSSPCPPTVVMCGNDVLAVGAMAKARDMGMSVPTDVSITGFDDIELARIVTPALTTVHVPHRKMGTVAAVELIEMLENRSTGQSVNLDVSLQIRASLARL